MGKASRRKRDRREDEREKFSSAAWEAPFKGDLKDLGLVEVRDLPPRPGFGDWITIRTRPDRWPAEISPGDAEVWASRRRIFNYLCAVQSRQFAICRAIERGETPFDYIDAYRAGDWTPDLAEGEAVWPPTSPQAATELEEDSPDEP